MVYFRPVCWKSCLLALSNKWREKCCNRLLTKFQPNDQANNMSHRTRSITAYYSSKLDHHTVLYYKRQTCIRSVGVTSYKIENYTIAIFLAQKYIKSILIQRKQKKMLMVGHQPLYKNAVFLSLVPNQLANLVHRLAHQWSIDLHRTITI